MPLTDKRLKEIAALAEEKYPDNQEREEDTWYGDAEAWAANYGVSVSVVRELLEHIEWLDGLYREKEAEVVALLRENKEQDEVLCEVFGIIPDK